MYCLIINFKVSIIRRPDDANGEWKRIERMNKILNIILETVQPNAITLHSNKAWLNLIWIQTIL